MPKYLVEITKMDRTPVMSRTFEHQGVPTFDEFETFAGGMAHDALWDGLVEMGERLRMKYRRDTAREHESVFAAPWITPEEFEEAFEDAAEDVPEWATRFAGEVEKMREIADYATDNDKVTQKMVWRLVSFLRAVDKLVTQDEARTS